jgi:flagellar hook-length control protein FliK
VAKGLSNPIDEVPTPIKPQGPGQAPTVSGDAASQLPTAPPATDAATQAAGTTAVDQAAANRASARRQTSPAPLDEPDGATASTPDAQAGTPTLRAQDPVASKGTLTPAQAKAALDLAVPGVKLQTHAATPSDAPAAPAKPALTELLSQPKPEVETPRILTPGTAEFTALHGAAPAVTTQATAAPTPATSPVATGADSALAMAAPGVTAGTRVPAPTATLEAPPAAQHSSLVSQVDGSIKWLLKNQDQSAELQLHPESLGTVRIKLSVEGTEVHARIWASDPAALPTLHENRAFLEASLRDQGLTLGSFNLQQGRQGEQTPQSSQASMAASGPLVTSVVGQETPTPLAPLPSDAHRIEIVA